MKGVLYALGLVGAAGASVGPTLPSAASTQLSQVTVQLGPAVQARRRELGADALEQQRLHLEQAVVHALSRSAAPPVRVDLVIADIQPNRPTPAELGASAGLSSFSLGLGGAAITGRVVGSDGTASPVHYRYFPPNLQNETNFDTWGDADYTFDMLAQRIASGGAFDDGRSWPPPHRPSVPTGTRITD